MPNSMFMLIKIEPADNDATLIEMAEDAGVVVAAWGNHGKHMERDKTVKKLIPKLHYLKLTKSGSPSHPLYLPKDLKPILWRRK